MDLTNFYGFVKKMVQKNQYTYNVPPVLTLTVRREALSLRGRVGRVGRMGRVGWVGRVRRVGRDIKIVL